MLKLPKDNFILLETNKADKDNRESLLFKEPVAVVSCRSLKKVERTLKAVDSYVKNGFYAAGFMTYEAGYAFEKEFLGAKLKDKSLPLAWFGIFKKPVMVKNRDLGNVKKGLYKIERPVPSASLKEYTARIEKIKAFIARGDTYQVNYTFNYDFGFKGSPYAFYRDLAQEQPTSFSAFLKVNGVSILSLSPELFFRRKESVIETKPMKGTMQRGVNAKDDAEKLKELRNSAKNLSENVMIVDLLRNDLSRICRVNSVRTGKLFEVERYSSLFQMVSHIKGKLNKGVTYRDIFRNIFPSGSVTGAPKIRTMEIIRNLERGPRGVYTGCIGYIAPPSLKGAGAGSAVFNVAIRTVRLDKAGKGRMGIGSGIVIDSSALNEYEECLLKGKFLREAGKDLEIFETILLRYPGGYFLLEPHLSRLKRSAGYFELKYDEKHIRRELTAAAARLKIPGEYRVRIVLRAKVEAAIEARPMDQVGSKKAVFSALKVNSRDEYLYHKTSRRQLYDRELSKYKEKGFADVLFTNEKGEVTEGARTNIFILKDGKLYTPPVSSGLLAGIYRGHMLEKDVQNAFEKVLRKKDVFSAEKVYLSNSLRGLIEVSVENNG